MDLKMVVFESGIRMDEKIISKIKESGRLPIQRKQ